MSETQIASSQIIEEKNPNKNLENYITSSITQINNIDNNLNIDNPSNSGAEKEKKIGYFMLTPLESFLLNKMMPQGFKFETEENILKSLESPKEQIKRYKQIEKHIDNSYKSNSRPKNTKYENRNRGVIQKRRTYKGFNNLDNISICASTVASKCKLGLEKIKNNTWINKFYYSSNPEAPCISKIEQKVNKNEYQSLYDFEMDLRKVWNYFFNLGQKSDNDLYEKTSKMSEKWEQICSELENTNDNMYNYSTVKKRTETFYKSNESKSNFDNINSLINKENSESEIDNSIGIKKNKFI